MTYLTVVQQIDRLAIRVTELTFWADRAHIDLDRWTFNGEPIEPGEAWPQRDGVALLEHPEIVVPSEWPLEDARLDLNLGGEGLVRVHYREGREEGFGLDPYHQRFPLQDRRLAVEARIVARLPFGVPNRDARLQLARLTLIDPDVTRLIRQILLVIETARALRGHEVIEPLVRSAERAILSLSWPSDTSTYLSRVRNSESMLQIWNAPQGLSTTPAGLGDEERALVREASRVLVDDLRRAQERFPQHGRLALTGQAHLDLAWLWPMDETRRKAQRTYHSMMGLLNRYPEFKFHQSTAQVYAFLEEDDPALFAQIQDKAAEGAWEPIGGMWVEPDANMPTGESLVRQVLYGQRYFKSRFGARHTVCWMPDCFGFSPALPQILLGGGITSFFTVKLTWSETNRFPHDLFWWEGLDGSRILSHMFNNPGNPAEYGLSGYNGDPSPQAIVGTWEHFGGKAVAPESLLSIGYGDGGGGVTYEMLEQARELKAFPAVPALAFTHVRSFFERLQSEVATTTLPVWVGELYLELHRGTLTSQGRTKYLHRRAERDLIACEALAGMCALATGEVSAGLEEQWRVLLRNQFHDILPGSSIREVYETAEKELQEVIEVAAERSRASLAALCTQVVPSGDAPALLVVNPDLRPRPIRVEFSGEFPGAQSVEGGSVLCDQREIPGLAGMAMVTTEATRGVEAAPDRLENDFVRVTLDAGGTPVSVYDKRAGREALAGPGNQLWAYVDKPRQWDAWDVDATYAEQGELIAGAESVHVLENGPHRAAVRVKRVFRSSSIVQDIRLWANSARIDFRTRIEWHDRRWLIKARFPLAVHSHRATCETAFGVIERPTHRNTTWDEARFEVVAHRFVDLSEPGYGVALLNDGKYGHHVIGNEVGISLLRSPVYPDPYADEGTQVFTYSLFPHAGTWLEGGVLMEAEDLNRPLLVHGCTAEREAVWQSLRLSGPPLALGALKPLEDGNGLVLRVYEPQGARGQALLELPEGWEAVAELNLLEDEVGEPDFGIRPFGLHSWLLRRP